MSQFCYMFLKIPFGIPVKQKCTEQNEAITNKNTNSFFDIHVQKNEIWPLHHIKKINSKRIEDLNIHVEKYETLRTKQGESFMTLDWTIIS